MMTLLLRALGYRPLRVPPSRTIIVPEEWAGRRVALVLLPEPRSDETPADRADPRLPDDPYGSSPSGSPPERAVLLVSPKGAHAQRHDWVRLPSADYGFGPDLAAPTTATIGGKTPLEAIRDADPDPLARLTAAGPWPSPIPVPRELAEKIAKWAKPEELVCYECERGISKSAFAYSIRHHNRPLCMEHQRGR